MEASAKAITDYGITVVAVVALAVVVWWFIRDLRTQRDRALSLAESAVSAFDRLADQLGMEPSVKPARPERAEGPRK